MSFRDAAMVVGEALQILGEGAFGLAVARPHSNLLYKLLKKKEDHNAFSCDVQKKAKECAKGVVVPTCKFVDQPFSFNEQTFPCFVKMQRVFAPPNQQGLVQCCLKFEHRHEFDGWFSGFTDTTSSDVWMPSEEIDVYLKTLDSTSTTLHKSSDVAAAIGAGVASFIAAGINPFDVEYVLGCASPGAPVEVFALDFGEASLLEQHDRLGLSIDTEIYFPLGIDASEEDKNAFIESGFQTAGTNVDFLKHFSYALRQQYE
jgi:hypothetical protein